MKQTGGKIRNLGAEDGWVTDGTEELIQIIGDKIQGIALEIIGYALKDDQTEHRFVYPLAECETCRKLDVGLEVAFNEYGAVDNPTYVFNLQDVVESELIPGAYAESKLYRLRDVGLDLVTLGRKIEEFVARELSK